mmetsp:Transcript_95404/g.294307  ORF Transcript_95404/g.294307 Transcript_95404/m.294307 type:complete len:363 (+) Transcript_95404:237-1325(+)
MEAAGKLRAPRCGGPSPADPSQFHLGEQLHANLLELPRVSGDPRQAQSAPGAPVRLHHLGLEAESLGLAPHHEAGDLAVADAVCREGPEHLLDDVLGRLSGTARDLERARPPVAGAFAPSGVVASATAVAGACRLRRGAGGGGPAAGAGTAAVAPPTPSAHGPVTTPGRVALQPRARCERRLSRTAVRRGLRLQIQVGHRVGPADVASSAPWAGGPPRTTGRGVADQGPPPRGDAAGPVAAVLAVVAGAAGGARRPARCGAHCEGVAAAGSPGRGPLPPLLEPLGGAEGAGVAASPVALPGVPRAPRRTARYGRRAAAVGARTPGAAAAGAALRQLPEVQPGHCSAGRPGRLAGVSAAGGRG